MNRYARWGIALAVLPLAACASNPPAPPVAAAPPPPPPLASADASFVTLATQGGLAEIQEGQLAQKMSHNPKVLAFANKMITDHGTANSQLAQIATTKGATPPTAPNDTQVQEATKLQSEKGHRFDHDYIADQIAGHQQQLLLFKTEAQSGTDPDLKTFAANTVPIIQQHLDMANELVPARMHKGMHHHHHHHGE